MFPCKLGQDALLLQSSGATTKQVTAECHDTLSQEMWTCRSTPSQAALPILNCRQSGKGLCVGMYWTSLQQETVPSLGKIWAGSDIRLSLGLKYKDIVRLLKPYLPSFAMALAARYSDRQVLLSSINNVYSSSSYKRKDEHCPRDPSVEIHYVQLELLLTGCIFQLRIWFFSQQHAD